MVLPAGRAVGLKRLRVCYVGNGLPPHSTENHVARALRNRGHVVTFLQENQSRTWRALARQAPRADLLLWTRTGWDWPRYGLSHVDADGLQRQSLARCADAGIPSVGYHLDRWWGLDREGQIATEAFFKVRCLVTADGGHDEQWAKAGIDHAWLPPAISLAETAPGVFRPGLASDVAFVGSWQGGYHPEWPHRAELVAFLRDTYGDRCAFWPKPGRPAVRGRALRNLYASVEVLVGDSCLAGGVRAYNSDRIPETLGRGGFLVHPDVAGVTDGTQYTAGEHLATWPLGNWGALRQVIDGVLADDEGRRAVAAAGRAHVLARHTYEHRVDQLVELLTERGLL